MSIITITIVILGLFFLNGCSNQTFTCKNNTFGSCEEGFVTKCCSINANDTYHCQFDWKCDDFGIWNLTMVKGKLEEGCLPNTTYTVWC